MVRSRFLVALAPLVLAASIGVAQAQTASTLSGGASSIQETYQDWRVTCAQGQVAAHSCIFSQVQANQNGQRVLGIELTPDGDGRKAHGNLVLPFGLQLDAGARLQIDDGAMGEVNRFSTCLPVGCVVPLLFGDAAIPFLKGGQKLNIHASAMDSGQAVVLPISLAGFSGALDRTLQLLPAP
ncbi:invasion associated locus B family protein [Devosia sp. A369]